VAKASIQGKFLDVVQDMEGALLARLAMPDGATLNIGLSKEDLGNPRQAIRAALEDYIRIKALKVVGVPVPAGEVISVELDVPDDYTIIDPGVSAPGPQKEAE